VVTATPPNKIENTNLLIVTYGLAAALCVMVLSQLLNFEGFVEILFSYQLFNHPGSIALAIILIVLEIFSLPVLLRLWLSPLMRMVSSFCLLLAPAAWTSLIVFTYTSGNAIATTGMLGHYVKISLSIGIILSAVLLVTATWSYAILGGHKAVRRS
jgi:hypothetical protein